MKDGNMYEYSVQETNMLNQKGFFILMVTVVFVMTGCITPKKEALYITGSTTVLPVVARAAERFNLQHPDITIIINAGGSGVGINQLGEQKISIAMASREITSKEREKYPRVRLVAHVIALDAVVPAVSSEIFEKGIHALTIRQVAAIFKGEITNWKEVNGPDKKILVVDKEKSRGTRHVFMKHILGDKEAVAPGADLVVGSNNEEQTAIVQSNAALGLLSQALAE